MLRSCIVAVMLLMGVPVAAQVSSGGDPLKDICTGFLQQGGAGIAGDHERLCTCLVTETQRQLTREEMIAYSRATETGQQPPPAVMQKVLGIATTCLTRAK